MNQKEWSHRAIIRYTLFQVPGIVLLVLVLILVRRWMEIPFWFFWGMIVLWVAKDVIMFPFVWRAYDPDHSQYPNSLIGSHGTAQDRLAPSGYVRIRGELWKAEVWGSDPPIEKGKSVRVMEVRGLTLIVLPGDE